MIALKEGKCQSFSFTFIFVDCTLIQQQRAEKPRIKKRKEMKYLLSNKTGIWWRIMKLRLRGRNREGLRHIFLWFYHDDDDENMYDVRNEDLNVCLRWFICKTNSATDTEKETELITLLYRKILHVKILSKSFHLNTVVVSMIRRKMIYWTRWENGFSEVHANRKK